MDDAKHHQVREVKVLRTVGLPIFRKLQLCWTVMKTAGTNLTLHMLVLGANIYRTQSQDEAGFPERHAGQIVSTSQSL